MSKGNDDNMISVSGSDEKQDDEALDVVYQKIEVKKRAALASADEQQQKAALKLQEVEQQHSQQLQRERAVSQQRIQDTLHAASQAVERANVEAQTRAADAQEKGEEVARATPLATPTAASIFAASFIDGGTARGWDVCLPHTQRRARRGFTPSSTSAEHSSSQAEELSGDGWMHKHGAL